MIHTKAKKKTKSKKKGNITSKIIKGIWIAFAALLVLVPLYIFTVSINLFNLYGEQPGLKVLENPKDELSSELYSADNVLLGKYYRENRTPVKYEDLSPHLIKALVAVEDIRYEEHSGIDLRGLTRAAVFYLLPGTYAGGGSTLTQQLVKNLFEARSERFEGFLPSHHPQRPRPRMQVPRRRTRNAVSRRNRTWCELHSRTALTADVALRSQGSGLTFQRA